MKDKQKQIIKHYGLEHQLNLLIEESAELVQAICKWQRNWDSDNCIDSLMLLIEEVADVKNLIQQVELSNDFIKEGIERNIEYKVNRQLGRMKRE